MFVAAKETCMIRSVLKVPTTARAVAAALLAQQHAQQHARQPALAQCMQHCLRQQAYRPWLAGSVRPLTSSSASNPPAPTADASPLTTEPDPPADQPKTRAKKPDPLKDRKPVVLLESDLVEKFTKGGGAGGQKINKACSSVQLLHKPTGLFVETQRFRERSANRKEARKLLTLKVDLLVNGEASKVAVRAARKKKKDVKQRKRSKKKYEALAQGETGGNASSGPGPGFGFGFGSGSGSVMREGLVQGTQLARHDLPDDEEDDEDEDDDYEDDDYEDDDEDDE
ncbi:RF-1 domain-containing protein [Entophlyctis helioformis]|nr:RF-1 domain-containing protein [Entophlyctis helioformis]